MSTPASASTPSHQRCAACAAPAAARVLDLGAQPANNYFPAAGEPAPATHRLQLGFCDSCGTIQLIDPMPATTVKSRHEWLSYNEPEGHLDALVERLLARSDLGSAPLFAGLTYKDDSTLARLERLGVRVRRGGLADQRLRETDPLAGLETVQAEVHPGWLAGTVPVDGADVLLVRHVLEHARDANAFLGGLTEAIRPEGLLLFEVPDARKFIDACDYPFLWEEHISYFTEATLRSALEHAGFEVVDMVSYPYPFEDSLIALARRAPATAGGRPAPVAPAGERARCERFAGSYPQVHAEVREALQAVRANGGRIGLFGAGHLAAKFLNFYGLADIVGMVIDDNPNKLGRTMPGSGTPIVPSSVLAQGEVDLCLLALNPESEAKVVAKQQAFVTGGGKFASIFRLAPSCLWPQR